jgi:hypothetical protein
MGDVEVHRQIVDTTEDAERLEFLGSPTILIDGCDRWHWAYNCWCYWCFAGDETVTETPAAAGSQATRAARRWPLVSPQKRSRSLPVRSRW